MFKKRFHLMNADGGGSGAPGGAAPPAGGAPASGGESGGSWYSGFSTPELRGVAENNGWKSPEDAVRNYAELSKKLGVPKDRLLTLPDRDDDADGWNSVYNRLGRPEKAEGYEFDKLKGSDPEYANAIAKVMHEQGISKRAATKIVEAHSQFLDNYLKSQADAKALRDQTDTEALKKEWGDNYQSISERGGQAVKELWGEDADEIMGVLSDKFGHAKASKMIAKLADKAGEASFKTSGEGTGGNSGFGYSPDGAKAEIARLKTDKDFMDKYFQGDKGARDKLVRLMQLANPGSQAGGGISATGSR